MNNRRKVLTLFAVLYGCTALYSQSENSEVLPDTSYFKPGEDSYNLVESVINNHLENVTMLLDRGADANAYSSAGNSALIYATEKGNLEIMQILLEHGADINAPGFRNETPLFISIFANNFQAAKFLLENGADPNVTDDLGVTPLMYAAATNQYQSADLLMFYDADETVTDKEGNDPLLTAVTFENIETSDVLLQNGLSPDVQDTYGNTPAIVATQRGNVELLLLLLDYKADVNITNDKSFSPLAYAVTFNDLEISRLLIEHGANVNHQVSEGRNILELALITKNDSLILLLEENGAGLIKRPDFSDFRFIFGNSFSTKDYFVQFRGSFVDRKFGYFIETGLDYRPILLKVQTTLSDTLYQFRERRMGWSHGLGKYFSIYESPKGLKLSAYASVNGYLSFSRYMGTSKGTGINYDIIPGVGTALWGNYVGVKAGIDYYKFGTMLETGLKFNLSLFLRIVSPGKNYDRKEINWE